MQTHFFFRARRPLALTLAAFCALVARAQAAPGDYFRIDVVDAQTGRGVPLVELRTTEDVLYLTDSNGIAAIGDPELMGQQVYFQIKSHGYDYPKDWLGYRGVALPVKAGGRAQIKINRVNIAERLYRITGAGIYRDSVLVGAPQPLQNPLQSGLVTGQDTVEATPYRGKIFWLWGDTNRFAYPLGNFKTSSATSLLPAAGGLDPDKGVNLDYFVNSEGFSKEMIPAEGSKPVWMGGLFTLQDGGRERLLASYAKVESDSVTNERGLAQFNDDRQIFEIVKPFETVLAPGGDPFYATAGGRRYLYFDPFERVAANYASVQDGHQYQAYTPLVAGEQARVGLPKLERDANGQLVYDWKTDTAQLSRDNADKLIKAGQMKPDESPFGLRDIESDAPVSAHGSSTYWNPYRGRWARVFTQQFGTSALGEIWYAEADTPVGPWLYCRKVVTHDKYTFYNPTQHPFFSADNGRLIYFEGTYTTTYSGAEVPTPRYNYNQMMYRLNLADPRLHLPAPVYALSGGNYAMRDTVEAAKNWPRVQAIPFYAMAPADKAEGLVAVYAVNGRLQTQAAPGATPIFYALPAQDAAPASTAAAVPLYGYSRAGKWSYSSGAEPPGEGWTRAEQPLCRVWRNPSSALMLDPATKAE